MPRPSSSIAFLFLVAFLALVGPAIVMAGPLEDGNAAYDRGDYSTARKKWEPLARKGNASAQNNLGLLYSEGHGVEADMAEAFRWFSKAAAQGDAMAQKNLGLMYFDGNGVEQDYAEALKWYRKAADSKLASAQARLAYMLETGLGTQADPAEAAKWYRKAADQGDAYSQNSLGILHEYGRGVEQDLEEAVKWYRKAAKQNDPSAQGRLAYLLETGQGTKEDVAEAARLYRKAADQGDAYSQSNLGILYETGRGVEQDYAEAIKWYRKAADQDNASALGRLAYMLETGLGTKEDVAEAARLYRRAADQGDAYSQSNLGILYETGRGVEQDYAEALKWYRKAADQGNDSAQNNLAVMLEFGRGTAVDLNEAFDLYKLSAAQGNSDAQKNLGVFYYIGRIAGRDFEQAAEWIGKSAENGNAGGEYMLAILHFRGQGVEKDMTEAARLFGRAAEKGEVGAQNAIGYMYFRGFGVKQDYAVAEGWFRKAIAGGEPFAMQNLGAMHELGLGMPKNPDEALRLYRQAVATNPDMDSAKADIARLEGRPAEAYELYRGYAEREGDAHSFAQMALMHENGLGVARDEAEAIRLYTLSSKEPDAPAFVAENLAKLQRSAAATEDAKPAVAANADDVSGAPAQSLASIAQDDAKESAGTGTATAGQDTSSQNISNERRVALVLGNGAYQAAAPLPNPTNDARAIASMLAAMGFKVIDGADLDRSGMERKIREFVREASQADVSLLFYAGHGIQVAGKNYLVPVDARIEDVSALDFELIDIDSVTNYMGGVDKVGIVLLDACRDNPLARSLARTLGKARSGSVSVGLAPMASTGGGLLVGYATAPNDTASDGDGANSPFTTALLKFMPAPGLEIQQVMTRVKAEVIAVTKNEQRPWHNSDLPTEVFLAGKR